MLIIILPMNNEPHQIDNIYIALIYLIIALFLFIWLLYIIFSFLFHKWKNNKEKRLKLKNISEKYLYISEQYNSPFILKCDEIYIPYFNIPDIYQPYMILKEDHILFINSKQRQIILPYNAISHYDLISLHNNNFDNSSIEKYDSIKIYIYDDIQKNKISEYIVYFNILDDDAIEFNNYSLSKANLFNELDKLIYNNIL